MSSKYKYYNNKYTGPIKLDLGCGAWKKQGFIGIDNFIGKTQWGNDSESGIDIVHDLSKGIPFMDSTVDEVYASHFLEHTDIDSILKEINRVCKNGSLCTFVLPYANSAEGMFPGHNQFFTEKYFELNTLYNELFTNTEYEYTPSDEWVNGKVQKYTKMPFDVARIHLFNVCKWFTIKCTVKK